MFRQNQFRALFELLSYSASSFYWDFFLWKWTSFRNWLNWHISIRWMVVVGSCIFLNFYVFILCEMITHRLRHSSLSSRQNKIIWKQENSVFIDVWLFLSGLNCIICKISPGCQFDMDHTTLRGLKLWHWRNPFAGFKKRYVSEMNQNELHWLLPLVSALQHSHSWYQNAERGWYPTEQNTTIRPWIWLSAHHVLMIWWRKLFTFIK